MRILHLSDLHFGYDQDQTAKTQRELLLEKNFPNVGEIDLVMITGDITWRNKEDGYRLAEKWINNVLRKMIGNNVPIISCCGNHDLDQKEVEDLVYPCEQSLYNAEDYVNKNIKIENIDKLNKRFSKYIEFCEKVGFEKLQILDEKSYIVGNYQFKDTLFWIFNSAWFALNGGKKDRGKLWLSRNFFDCMDNSKDEFEHNLHISMFHHPKEWFQENVIVTNDKNKSALFDLIAAECDFCFTGHTHGYKEKPDIINGNMSTFSAGATYAEKNYNNNFSVLEIEEETKNIERIIYYTKDNSWEKIIRCHIKNNFDQEKKKIEDNKIVIEKSKIFESVLEDLDFHLIRVTNKDFDESKIILWPVVPRDTLTTIHIAQFSLMRILHDEFNWKIKAIISDCGSKNYSKSFVKAFEQKLISYSKTIGIEDLEIEKLGNYFKAKNPIVGDVMAEFVKICSQTKTPDLKNIKLKNYSDKKKAMVENAPVIDFILPMLQCSIISKESISINNETGKKPIVIAGADEKMQWEQNINLVGRDKLGAILIPELKINGLKKSVDEFDDKNLNQLNQDAEEKELRQIINIISKRNISDNLQVGNVKEWLKNMFINLPLFLQQGSNIDMSDKELIDQCWCIISAAINE